MTFLMPTAFALLSLLAIPILVHLFKPRKTTPAAMFPRPVAPEKHPIAAAVLTPPEGGTR